MLIVRRWLRIISIIGRQHVHIIRLVVSRIVERHGHVRLLLQHGGITIRTVQHLLPTTTAVISSYVELKKEKSNESGYSSTSK